MEIPSVPDVILRIFIITKGGEYGVKDIRTITGHFREPGSRSSVLLGRNGFPLSTFSNSRRQPGWFAQDVDLSYKTTLRAYDILRRVLVEELAKIDEILKGELMPMTPTLDEREKEIGGEVREARLSSTGSWNEQGG